MAKLKRGKKQQPSSRPEGWLAAGIVVPVKLTVRQERYAKRCLGISRFVYNLATSTHRFHRRNRLAWPNAHEMAREFNAAKGEDYPFVTEVSKFVAQGAFRNFGRAIARWRDPEIKSGPPTIRRKNRTGAGSFLAASGINLIKYDGHRRIKLPYLGSVKLARELPEGIAYEVTVKHQNGRWYASIAYWKPPLAPRTKHTTAAAWTWVSTHWPWTAPALSTRTPGHTTRHCANCAAGNGPKPGAPPAPEAGGKHNDASTRCTDALPACATTLTTRSAEPWSTSTTPWASRH